MRYAKLALIVTFVAGSGIYRWHTRPKSNPNTGPDQAEGQPQRITSDDHPPSKRGNALPAQITPQHITAKYVMDLARKSISFDEAKRILAQVNSSEYSLQDRRMISSALILAMNKQGMDDEAWSLIDNDPGYVRDSGIGTFIRFSESDTLGIISRISSIVDSKDYNGALNSLALARPMDVIRLLSEQKISADGPEVSSIMAGIMAATSLPPADSSEEGDSPLLADKDNAKRVIDDVAKLVAAGKVTPEQFSELIDRQPGDAFDQWNALNTIKNSTNNSGLQICQQAVARNMVMTDADLAMKSILKDEAAKNSIPVWNTAISVMFEADATHANDWLKQNLGRLEPDSEQAIISSVARLAIKDNDLATARKWAERMQDGQAKDDILSKLNQ